MSEELNPDWKVQVINRYLSQFEPATETNATVRKTSHDICRDLEEMGDFQPKDITVVMIDSYPIGFEDDNTPVWLLCKK